MDRAIQQVRRLASFGILTNRNNEFRYWPDVALGSMSDAGSDDELFGPAYPVPPAAPPSEPPRGRHASAAAFGASHTEQQKVAVEVDTTAPKRGPSQNTMQSVRTYVLIAYWEKRERGLCSLGP